MSKKAYIRLIFMIPFLLLSVSCVTDEEPDKSAALTVGDSLPDFSVTLDNGSQISKSSLIGKVSMIVFFNTSCPDCRQELPQVQKVWEKLAEDPDVIIFAISREEGYDSVKEYWLNNQLTIPFSAQDNRTIYNLFASSIIPRIFISDANGIITASFGDTRMPDEEILLESIEESRLMNNPLP